MSYIEIRVAMPRLHYPSSSMSEFFLIIQCAIGIIFLWSASSKIIRPGEFLRGLLEYDLFPSAPLTYASGLIVVVVEGAIAFSHLTGWLIEFLVPTSIIFLFGLAVVVGYTLRRGLRVNCLCFGLGGDQISVQTIYRLALLTVAEIVLWVGISLSYSAHNLFAVEKPLLLGVSGALAIVLASWVVALPDLIAFRRSCRRCSSANSKG